MGIEPGDPVHRAFTIVWNHLVVEDDLDEPADVIFCFGSRHWRVPHRAAELHDRGVARRILITGGVPSGEQVAEADRFAATLRRRGIPPADLILERHATNTGENVRLGLRKLDHLGPLSDLVLVCWPLAARRGRATFRRWAPGLRIHCAPALSRPGRRWNPNPKRIRLALGELDRLRRYRESGVILDGPVPDDVIEASLVLHDHLARIPATSSEPTSAANHPLDGIEPAGPIIETEHLPVTLRPPLDLLGGQHGGEVPMRSRPPA